MRVRVTGVAGKAQAVSVDLYDNRTEITLFEESPAKVLDCSKKNLKSFLSLLLLFTCNYTFMDMAVKHARVWTIGHSRHELEEFVQILKRNEISVLVDVRTVRMSRIAPQFNEGPFKIAIMELGITYIAMGEELGGRPEEDFMYDSEGRVFYNKLAESEHFKSGIERILTGSAKFNVAIMCSEGKPEGCHRHLLIGRVLQQHGVEVLNILVDGSIKSYKDLNPNQTQLPLIDLGEEETWKSILPVRQESRQNDSFVD